MAFTEFDGELDDEAGFKPFDGELDAPAATAKAEPGLADRYRGQFEQAKKMMAPAPATSVLDRASRAPAADPMLRPEFIEEQRAIYGKMPEANRLPVLRRMATRDDVQGRAAKVLLAEAESMNATGRQAERDMPEFARVIAEGPRVAPPAGTGPRKPRPVSFPDAQPDITEIGAMPTEAQTLARRGAGGVLAAAAADPATLAERARVDATDWNQVEFARENPVIAGAGSGGARALGGIINAPGTAAQFLAETLLNPISRRLGGDGFERVPNAPLVDGLMQAAQEWSSPQMTQEPMEAWDRDQFGTWLAANVAAQAPMFAQQVVAFMVPAARAMILPGMGAQVAGGEYAGGDSAVAAVGKGAAEAGSELISLGVMDKARSFFLKLPPGQRAAAVKDLAKRVGAASAAVVGSSAGESGTEILSQLGQNAIDQLAGKDTPLTSGLLASAIVGAVAGGGMMVPAAMTDLRRSSTDGSRMSVEDALITALETGQTRPAPPVIRVEDMPTTPLTPEQVAAIAPQPQVEPIPTGEVTELPGMPTDDGERIPTGQATELAGPRATTPADLGVSSVPQGSLAAMAEQQLRARFVQPVVPANAPLAAPAADAGRDQPGRSVGALGRMADDGRTGSVLPAEPVPAGRGGADQPAAAGDAPRGLTAEPLWLQAERDGLQFVLADHPIDAEILNLRGIKAISERQGLNFDVEAMAGDALRASGRINEVSKTPGAQASPPSAVEPRIQNRDRGDLASVQQMQSMARNLDYNRVSISRDFANGAPVVLAVDVPSARLGRMETVTTSKGRKLRMQYALIDAADLLPSHDADGNPMPGYAEGAPGKAKVVAGNARGGATQAAYRMGLAESYKADLISDADAYGADPEGMPNPVLVRIMRPEDVTDNIGDESNVSGVADKSAREAARDDARRLDLSTLDFNDDGTVTRAAQLAFVNAMPVSEQTGLRLTDGSPSVQAQNRLMGALFETAYQDDELLGLYTQAIDIEARVVMAGLAAAAPQMVRLKNAGGLDIRPQITQAAKAALNAKRRGIKMADIAAQTDMSMDPDVLKVLRMFARNNRSAKRIGEELRMVAKYAYDLATQPSVDMFGDVPRASRSDVLARLDEPSIPQNLEVPGGAQPVRGDLRPPTPDTAAEADGAGTEAGRPAADQAAQDLAEAPTAEPFTTNGQALVYAAQNGIAGKVKPVEVTGGWALVPKERAPSVLTAEADAKALEAANTALAKSKWRTPAGKPWKLKPAKNVPPIFKTVAAIIDAAFGVRVQAVNGAPGNGLQFRRGAFVDTARVTSPETLIGVTGHEVKHWLDANDKATGAKLDQAIEQHLKAGAVQAQMARENAQLVAGETPMTEAGARLELLSDINGALWVDPDFWGRLYDLDSNAFRKVLYQFMRAATKFIKVAQGSTFDLTAYVDNVAAVRDAAAQAMVERAENRRGKAGPQMLVKNARRGRPSPLDQDLFAQPEPAPAADTQETGVAASLAQAERDTNAERSRWRAATARLPDGAKVGAWTKKTIAGDVMWEHFNGKRGTADVVVEAGRAAADAALRSAGLPTLNVENAAAAPVAERPSPRDRDLGEGGVAPTQAGGGTAPEFDLTAPTRGDVLAQQQARADETKAEAARRRARDEADRRDREQRDIADRARQDASAENFMLGQDADEALAGQGGLFNSRAARPETPQFKRWFDGSQVVNMKGEPRVMYHATTGDFSTFQPGPSGAIFVASTSYDAQRIASVVSAKRSDQMYRPSNPPTPDGLNVMPLYVSAKNVFDPETNDHSERLVAWLEKAMESDQALRTRIESAARISREPWMDDADATWQRQVTYANPLILESARVIEWMKEQGFDGFYVRELDEDDAGRNLAVFSPAQLKSATANTGAFDPENPDIRLSRGDQSGEWRLFPDTMGGKGIPRADMPQVKVKKRPALFKFLADQGITFERDTVPAGSLKPTQAEYSTAKTESAKTIPSTSDDQLVLLSSDGYVLDGHHRWLAKVEQGQDVEVLRFNAPIDDLMNAVWQSPDVVVNSDSAGVLVQGKETLPPPPARREKINIAADTAREYIYATEVDQAVALLEKFPDVPKADVPEADYARLAAMFMPEIDRAKAVNDQFVADLTAVADGLGAEVRTAPVKSLNRTVEKMYADEIDKGGKQAQPDWVRDLVRGTIVAENETAVPAALEALGKAMKIVRVKDRFAAPLATGYADILVNVELPNGMQGEVQIHTPPMLAAKDLGHMLYEVARALKPGADTTRLRMAQEKLYGAARALGRSESTSAAKASSETTSPSATTRPQGMSRPLITATQAPGLGSMTTGMPSTSTSLEPGGRFLQSNIGDSNAGPTSPVILPPGSEYARLADPFAENYARLEGRKVSFDVRIEDTGQTATFTVDAAQYLRELDQRRDVARRLADCVAR